MVNSDDVKIVDEVFGEMHYKHSWCRVESADWWNGQALMVQVTAQAYSGDEILDVQREAFSSYRKNIGEIVDRAIPMLMDYVSSSYGCKYSKSEIMEALIPNNVLFERDGSWGVLFDASFDIENGLAFFIDAGGSLLVGTQDDFL